MSIITYASLRKKYGKGEIVENAPPVRLTARLNLIHRGSRSIQVASAPFDKNAPEFNPTQLKDNEFDKKYASEEFNNGSGLMEFSFILTTAGANQNDQVFVEDELRIASVYQSPIGEAVDWDHDQSFMAVCGEIRSSEIFEAQGDRPMGIRCNGVIFSDMYPEIAKKIKIGAGRWAAVSMEALPNPLERIGKFLVIHNPVFVGAGLVRFPGNKFSVIENVDGEPTSANLVSVKEQSRFLENIVRQGVELLVSDTDREARR